MQRILDVIRRLLAPPELPLRPGESRRSAAEGARATLGARGEQEAVRLLRRKGYRILCRNRANSVGELDVVAMDGDRVVFVEVRARSHGSAVDFRDAVTPAKLRKVAAAAEMFCRLHGLTQHPMRLDVVGVQCGPDGKPARVVHMENVDPGRR